MTTTQTKLHWHIVSTQLSAENMHELAQLLHSLADYEKELMLAFPHASGWTIYYGMPYGQLVGPTWYATPDRTNGLFSLYMYMKLLISYDCKQCKKISQQVFSPDFERLCVNCSMPSN
jgi:hypothetical protein